MSYTDGDRWRALLSSARLRMLGWAGFGKAPFPPDANGYRHFGMEAWTFHTHSDDAGCMNATNLAKETLIAYTDAILERKPELQSGCVAAQCWEYVDHLRKDEGDAVTILCDNPEGPPNNAVECQGFWTNNETRRFEGSTILDALRLAYEARRDGR